jgi:hypothetical protein
MAQGVSNPSLSGSAAEFNVGGTAAYSDALWNHHLIGPLSSQGTFDPDGSLVPSLYNFTYDVDFYGDNFGAAEALEFDINSVLQRHGLHLRPRMPRGGGKRMGRVGWPECKMGADRYPSHPNNNSWNHLTIKVQRTSDNHLTYQSISLNGQTTTLNWTFEHGSAPNWYGITVNYQMDGDSHQDSYTVYLDNLGFTFQWEVRSRGMLWGWQGIMDWQLQVPAVG